MRATAATQPEPLISLLEQRDIGGLVKAVGDDPPAMLRLLQDAGPYGVFAYLLVFIAFYGIAVPVAEVAYHAASGSWLDPRVLLLQDGTDGKAEALALCATFYLLCKPFAPLRLGGALLLTPDVKRFVKKRPAIVAALATSSAAVQPVWALATDTLGTVGRAAYQAIAPRQALKDEFLELAARSSAGTKQLGADEEARLRELIEVELPALCPTEKPARSELFSAEWECVWTNERELNFAVTNGLFGLPWARTFQTIDLPKGELTNVIEFDGGELRVGSTIAADETDGSRFNFAFTDCSLTYKGVRIPLPPVGRGWGELLYLDEELRIQRDIRGDMLVAARVPSSE